MLYSTADAYLANGNKALFLFGMSGVGKTRIAKLLRYTGNWYHYSVDYRIGTRYLDEQMMNVLKLEAMRIPLFYDLLRTDSIRIDSNLAIENLELLSTYIGAPGNQERGGLTFEEYRRRQKKHREAEIAATLDAQEFIVRAREIYGYNQFVCDSSGSICELVDPDDPQDPIFSKVAEQMLPVYIRASETEHKELLRRFDQTPKPMYFREEFIRSIWKVYLDGRSESEIDPFEFLRYAFKELIVERLPRYEKLAQRWAVSIETEELNEIKDAEGFSQLVARAINLYFNS